MKGRSRRQGQEGSRVAFKPDTKRLILASKGPSGAGRLVVHVVMHDLCYGCLRKGRYTRLGHRVRFGPRYQPANAAHALRRLGVPGKRPYRRPAERSDERAPLQ